MWRFLAGRFAREEYLGLHLTIGFLVTVAGLWLFAGITEDVITNAPLTQFDISLLTWIRAHSTPAGDRIFSAISAIGSPGALSVLFVIVSVALAVRRRRLLCAAWILALAGDWVLNVALKNVVRRPRPADAALFLQGHSFSFPSGHAMGALGCYGMLAYLAIMGLERRAARWAIVGAAAVLVLAIGASRLYLGVHYFSDVVGGYAAATIWLAVCISGLEVARRRSAPGSAP
jgi:undecaprenyl-diphosphatase